MTPTVPKPRRTAPHIKMRPLSAIEWWTPFTAELLAFVLSGPTRSWTEIDAWGKARQYTDVTIFNMVAFLDLSRLIENLAVGDANPLWGEPLPKIECAACRAEKETGGRVRNLALHTCSKSTSADVRSGARHVLLPSVTKSGASTAEGAMA